MVTLVSIPEVARRLGISTDAAFDLVFVARELPLEFRGNDHGVPEVALDAYQRAHASH
ncbi:MAG: hypothetical protein J2P59_04010 [Acidimicrobiales bacterium]|nr:hypothetical protein [Acidimicrobiales bacterium]